MKLLSHVQSEQNGEKDKTIFKIFLCYSVLIYSSRSLKFKLTRVQSMVENSKLSHSNFYIKKM